MRLSKKTILLFGTEMILICLALIWAYHGIRSLKSIDLSIQNWTCPYTVYHDGAFSAEDDILNSGEEITFLYGPGTSLKKGTYAANIQYEAERDQSCMASGINTITPLVIPAEFVHASKGILSSSKDSILYKFEIPEDTREFNLAITYNGIGNFRVRSISVQQTGTYYKRTLSSFVLLLTAIDALYFFSKSGKEVKINMAVILGIGIAASIPLFFRQVGIYTGDMEFHLIRIDVVVQALRDRQFPPRISSLWMDGYGFPASIYYNDILLIFPAVLRLLGYDLHIALKAYILGVNILTAALAFFSFRGLFRSQKTAVLTAISYVLAPFRIGDLYTHRAIGEVTAMAFLPLVACAVIKMYTEDADHWKQYRRYGFMLVLGITGIAASHILTLVMTVFFLAVLCLILFRKTIRRNTFRLWLDSAILSVLISAYFLIPFADYYFNVDTLISQNTAVRGSGMIQNYGISLGRLLSFFPSSFTELESMPFTPGLLLTLAFVYGCCRYYFKRERRLLYCLIFSGTAVFLSMDCFPWNFLEMHTLTGRIMAQIQYPSRFLTIAVIVLCVLLGELCGSMETMDPSARKKAAWLILTLNAVFMIFYVSDYSVGWAAQNKYETESLNTFSTSLHYLPAEASTDRYAYTKDILTHGINSVSMLSRTTHTAGLHASSTNGGTLEVPILNYKGYHVTDSLGNEYPIRSGTNCRITFDVPAGFDGEITIAFRNPWYWTAGIAVTLISIMLYLAAVRKNCSRKDKTTEGSSGIC